MLYRLIVLLLTIVIALFDPILVPPVVRKLAVTMLESARSEVSRLLAQLVGVLGTPISLELVGLHPTNLVRQLLPDFGPRPR